MTILTQVLRTAVRCNTCQSAYIYTEGDVETYLTNHEWTVTDDQHHCPRCSRRAK